MDQNCRDSWRCVINLIRMCLYISWFVTFPLLATNCWQPRTGRKHVVLTHDSLNKSVVRTNLYHSHRLHPVDTKHRSNTTPKYSIIRQLDTTEETDDVACEPQTRTWDNGQSPRARLRRSSTGEGGGDSARELGTSSTAAQGRQSRTGSEKGLQKTTQLEKK
jgi:hypothetical protein